MWSVVPSPDLRVPRAPRAPLAAVRCAEGKIRRIPSADTADAVAGFIGGLVSVHTTAQRCERWPGAADSVVRAPCRRIQFSSSSASASAAFDNDWSASLSLWPCRCPGSLCSPPPSRHRTPRGSPCAGSVAVPAPGRRRDRIAGCAPDAPRRVPRQFASINHVPDGLWIQL